jgi:hypothetical protein
MAFTTDKTKSLLLDESQKYAAWVKASCGNAVSYEGTWYLGCNADSNWFEVSSTRDHTYLNHTLNLTVDSNCYATAKVTAATTTPVTFYIKWVSSKLSTCEKIVGITTQKAACYVIEDFLCERTSTDLQYKIKISLDGTVITSSCPISVMNVTASNSIGGFTLSGQYWVWKASEHTGYSVSNLASALTTTTSWPFVMSSNPSRCSNPSVSRSSLCPSVISVLSTLHTMSGGATFTIGLAGGINMTIDELNKISVTWTTSSGTVYTCPSYSVSETGGAWSCSQISCSKPAVDSSGNTISSGYSGSMTVKVIDSTCGTIYEETYSALNTTGYTCATDNCFCIKITKSPTQSAPQCYFVAMDSTGASIAGDLFYISFATKADNIKFLNSSDGTYATVAQVSGTTYGFTLSCTNTVSSNISFLFRYKTNPSCTVTSSTYTISAAVQKLSINFTKLNIIVRSTYGKLETYFTGAYSFGIVKGSSYNRDSEYATSIDGNFSDISGTMFKISDIAIGGQFEVSTVYTAFLILDINWAETSTSGVSELYYNWSGPFATNNTGYNSQKVDATTVGTGGLIAITFTTPSSTTDQTYNNHYYQVDFKNI